MTSASPTPTPPACGRAAGAAGLAGLRAPRFAFMQPLGVAISTLALAGLLITGGGLPFLATTTAPVSAPAPADTGATGGAAVARGADRARG